MTEQDQAASPAADDAVAGDAVTDAAAADDVAADAAVTEQERAGEPAPDAVSGEVTSEGEATDAPAAPDAAEPDPEPEPDREPEAGLEPEPDREPEADPGPEPEPEIELTGPASARLTQLGLELPALVEPLGSYLPAVRTGDLIFTSGQLPMVDGTLQLTGVVGDQPVDISVGQAKALARLAALNAVAAIARLVDIDSVTRVVKVVGFVASAPGFTQQPQVINGASDLLGQLWGDAGRHARSAVGVTALPMNSPVEVEVVVEVGARHREPSTGPAPDAVPDPAAQPG